MVMMIKLTKLSKPSRLSQNEGAWTTAFLAHFSSGGTMKGAPTHYRHEEIKSVVIAETHEKCAYCESKILHTQHGDVEHIAPKSVKKELVVDWLNLTLVCLKCNQNKGDYWDDTNPLINPYVEDPREHFVFAGPFLFHRPGNMKGLRTASLIKLNRTKLVGQRHDKLTRLASLLDNWESLPDGPDKDIYADLIWELADADSEFSAVALDYLDQVGFTR